jgi:hypothetical protein
VIPSPSPASGSFGIGEAGFGVSGRCAISINESMITSLFILPLVMTLVFQQKSLIKKMMI